MKTRFSVFAINCLIIVLTAVNPANAAPDKNLSKPEKILNTLDSIEKLLKKKEVDITSLETHLTTLPEYRNWAAKCLQSRESELKELQNNLESLGEPIKGEPEDVTKKRNSILQNQSASEKLKATCKLILLRSEETLERITKLKQSYLTERFLFKGPSFAKLLRENWENPGIWLTASKEFILKNSGLNKLDQTDFFLLFLLITLTLAAGLFTKKWLREKLVTYPTSESRSAHLLVALTQTGIRYIAYLLPSLAVAVFFYEITHNISPTPFISIVAYGLPIVSILLALIHAFLGSSLELKVVKEERAIIAKKLSHRLKTLVLVIFIGYLLFSTILAQSLPESALLLARGIYGVFIITNIIMVIWLIGRFNKARSNQIFRFLISLSLVGAMIAELYGYRNISLYVIRVVLGTLIAIDIFKLLSLLTTDFLDSLESGKGLWQQKLHSSIGLQADQNIPGVIWIRIIIYLMLWAGLASGLLVIWKVPESYVQTLISYITTGFTIGTIEILPTRILQAILVLPFLLTINAWFRKGLEQRWLKKTQMERGARESMATITGYIGISIAILISLSVAGMDFSKLALIAGALSVGIGFGLQNIVNNFVSGLILLFERPVKTGDWIQVGNVEGYVRKISIRSTQIQTFDRSDVIVPNSDLISGTVTNWMLYDQRGRIRVPVGVAYGSDTHLVKDLLLNVAKEHEQVINSPMQAPVPLVLFLGFGNSSLDFELRCHIKNIDTRRTTVSDINFAIDEAFRNNGIEIPFPQRDVHVRDISDARATLPNKDSPDKENDNKDPSL